MRAPVDHTHLHRTAKYFMDSGEAATHEEAMGILHRFGLTIAVGPEVQQSINHQIALLTLVNVARRTFLGGVEVTGLTPAPMLTPLTNAADLIAAVTELGGKVTDEQRQGYPVALIGDAKAEHSSAPAWRLAWSGWRGGVVPAHSAGLFESGNAIPLAAAVAAAACAAEVFSYYAKDHAMAGKRAAGLSLWQPGWDWLASDPTETKMSLLPSSLWLIGLGNLGQAYAWLLACLPYATPYEVKLVLQDFDVLARSNDSTSLLSSVPLIGTKKARAVAAWLDRIGFDTTIEERRFGEWTRRADHEPAVGLCGVDNALARAGLDQAGFGLVVEAGLGAGTSGFKNFSLHTFPSSRCSSEIWSAATGTVKDYSAMPAYQALKHQGMDACGLAQLASRTVGVPFVGLLAGSLVIAELLRRLHGGMVYEMISTSASNLGDVSASALPPQLYAFGHTYAREAMG